MTTVTSTVSRNTITINRNAGGTTSLNSDSNTPIDVGTPELFAAIEQEHRVRIVPEDAIVLGGDAYHVIFNVIREYAPDLWSVSDLTERIIKAVSEKVDGAQVSALTAALKAARPGLLSPEEIALDMYRSGLRVEVKP